MTNEELRIPLDDRMKQYERSVGTHLVSQVPVIGRLDGRCFHTLTRGLPYYDERLAAFMYRAAKALCEEIKGCRFTYVQSDEINVLVTQMNEFSQPWFRYDLQKMCSISAGIVANEFNKWAAAYEFSLDYAVFDARFFNLPRHEVTNYFVWRQQDAVRNSIQSLGRAQFSHKQLMNKSSAEIQELLFTEKNINWSDRPTPEKRGACVVKEQLVESGRPIWVIDLEIPTFTQDREYVEKRIMMAA